jgi:hypothetical protein
MRVAEEEEEMMQVTESRLSPEEAANATKEAVRDATVEGAKEGARKAAREGRLPGQVHASAISAWAVPCAHSRHCHAPCYAH